MGHASVKKLAGVGVTKVEAFVAMPSDLVRDMLTVTGQRTHAELNGISCVPFSDMPATRKSIACTRSFGRAVTDWNEMREAVATYAARAGEKMRRFGLSAGAMQVFLRTNEFNNDPRYNNQATFGIEPSADSRALIANAVQAASNMWRDGFRYAKAGVVLLDLYHAEELPAADMFATRDPEKSKKVMAALDALNGRFGRETVRPGGLVAKPAGWSMRRANLSPCYTTQIDDLMVVRSL